jgi:hypothetical protein
MLQLCRTLAVGKDKHAPRTVSTLFAVLYHLTGEESYKKAVFAKDGLNRIIFKKGQKRSL